MRKSVIGSIILLLISLNSFAQMGANISFGTDVNLGIQYKNFEVQGVRKISQLSRYTCQLNGIYHYGKIYGGYGTQGPVYGIRLQKNHYILSVGRYGNYNNITLGVSSLPKRKAFNLFTKREQAIMCLQFVSGFFRGWHEAIQSGHWGRGKQFWDNTISWKNKWKNGDPNQGEKFPLSTTAFAWTQDGYHLTNFGANLSDVATLAVSLNGNNKWKDVLKKVAISVVTNRVAFYLSYNQIFK